MTEVIGDMAYVSDENLNACGEEIELIARTNTAVRQQMPDWMKGSVIIKTLGLCRADSTGLFAMELQMYFTVFAVNIKRIMRLSVPVMQ